MMHELIEQVTIHDPFWSSRLESNSTRAIFHQWEQLEASGCIDNFRIVAGELDGFRQGWFFADSDAYKWLDAAARIYATVPDPALASLMDSFISLLLRAQDADGYIFTYNQVHFPGTRWTNLMIEHELYCHGHLVEAGISHHQATHQVNALDIARKAADRVTADFLGKGPAYTSGHEEIELALLRLYQLTGHAPYLEVARQLLEQRGRMPLPSFSFSLIRQLRSSASRLSAINKQRQDYISNHPGYTIKLLPPGNESKSPPNSTLRWLVNSLSGKYLQQHAPIREQTVPVGHSVRFGYLETAIARLYRLTGDESLIPTLEEAWERMVRRRMYITGGLGSVPRLEGFGRDYELDPEYAYAETCAALASLFWNWEMSLATGNARYSDLFEWQLYNAAAVGMGLSGTDYFYNNPLVCTGGFTRKPWYAVPCCPSNLSRTWADLGKYIYTVDDDKIWIHQYVGNATSMNTGQDVEITMESGFPWHGGVKIILKPLTPVNLTLYARLPSWASIERTSNTVKINGQSYDATAHQISTSSNDSARSDLGYDPTKSHFLPIQRLWSPGDVLELDFGMPVTLRRAHPKVKGHRGKVAVTRGPLVYCLESVDNPEMDIFSSILDPHSLESSWEPQLLGGIMLLRGRTMDGEPLVFIPYHLWANRGESKMTVWVYCAS